MAIPAGPYLSNGTTHPTFHQEVYELWAGMDAWRNVAAEGTLQAAHDALPSTGGTIWMPPGLEITPTATTTISKPVRLLGGQGAKIIQGGSSVYDLITVSATTGFEMAGVHLDGRLDAGRSADGNLLFLSAGCSNVNIHHNQFTNCRGAVGTSTHAYTNFRVERNYIFNSFYAGVYLPSQLDKAWVSYNIIDTTQDSGIMFDNPTTGEQINVWVEVNDIRNSQRAGPPGTGKAAIQTVGTTSNKHRRFKITGNTITNTTRGGGGSSDSVSIGLDQITDSLIEDNHIFNPSYGEGIIVLGYGNGVEGNRIEGVSASAIGLLSYGGERQIANCNVVGNICKGIGTSADQGNGITYVANAEAGNSITGVHIASNRCYNGSFGVLTYNDGGTMSGSNNSVIGNNLTGNGTAASFVSGSGQTTTANLPTL